MTKYFFTFRVNATGKIRHAIAATAQSATAQYNLWVGVCTILRKEEVPK